MKYTNRFNLPEAFVRACINDGYDSGGSDFSATSLEVPPRAAALIRANKDKIEVDVSSRVAAIIGQGAHKIAERAARPDIDICEKRYFSSFFVDGVLYKVSAQIDLYETDSKALIDWKTTKAYAFHKKVGGGKKVEWVYQMNVGAELMRRNGENPQSLHIVALLKDWDRREALSAGYPHAEVMSVQLPMWTSQETVTYIETRIRAHVAARTTLPQCTSKETWGSMRCKAYCDAAAFCDQYQIIKKTGLLSGDSK